MEVQQKVGNILKYKLVFIGDQAVGKTSIINRFIYDTFTGFDEPTVGIDFISKTLHVDNKTIRLQLWDTAGQEKFKSLIPSYVRDSDGVVMVYDITNATSFENISKWISYIQEERGNDVKIFLVGNKIDDAANRYNNFIEKVMNRKVSTEDGFNKANELKTNFEEASAKSGEKIQELFKNITNLLVGVDNTNDSRSQQIEAEALPKEKITLTAEQNKKPEEQGNNCNC